MSNVGLFSFYEHIWAQIQRNWVLFSTSAFCSILLQLIAQFTQFRTFGIFLANVGSLQHNSATQAYLTKFSAFEHILVEFGILQLI